MIVPTMGSLGLEEATGTALFGKTRRAVLALLFTSLDHSFYLNEIVREVGLGVGTVQRELRALTHAGLIRRTARGNQVFFGADPDSPVFAELKALVEKTMGAPVALRALLQPLVERIELAFIYGSLARGDAVGESDVDLLVVGDVPALELAAAVREAEEKLRREVNPVVFPPGEFRERIRGEDHFLTTVMQAPKIFLVGDEDDFRRLAG
ncbi:MAG: nucleotidyltransferase domain-containing protein [Candidatus Bipolaricaulota bacterium]